MTSLTGRQGDAGDCAVVLEERSFRCLLAHEADRATRYQDFFSLCLVRLDPLPEAGAAGVRQAVAAKIAELLRRSDLIGEVDGETAILLLHTTDADALRVAERIRATIGRVAFPGAARPVTVSMGEACFPHDGLSHTALLSRARAHLDEARRRGGDRVVHR